MEARPDLAAFAAAYEAGKAQVVSASLVADLETPVSAMLKLADGRPIQLPAGKRHRRCRARPLLDPGHQAGPDLALPGQPRRDQPARPLRQRRLRALRRAGAGEPAPAGDGKPDRAAARPAADGGRPVRPHGLRHGPADRAAAGRQSRPAGPARRRVPAADGGGPVRPYRGPDHRGHAGLAERRRLGARRPTPRPASGWPTPWPSSTAASATSPCGCRARLPEPVANVTREQYHAMVERAKEYIRAGDIFQVVPSQRFDFEFRLPPSRSTARCAGSTPRRSCSSSTSTTTRSSAPARRSWSACATAR